MNKYYIPNILTLNFYDHFGSLFYLYNLMELFYDEDKIFYRFEALNYNYVFNSLYGNYFVNFDVNLKFNLQILILSFMNYIPNNRYMSRRNWKYFKFLFKNGYSNFYKLNYLSLNKPYYSCDYFPTSLEDALMHDLYNVKFELSDINLEIYFDYNIFNRIKETHPFDIDVFISSFTAYWSDVYSINTFGFIGKEQFSKLNFIVVNSYLPYYSFYIHYYEDSSYFSIEILYMYFYYRRRRRNYRLYLGNVYFNMINIFNNNLIFPIKIFINKFYSFSFYNLFFYKFIFLFINILKLFFSLLHINLNYIYIFLQINLFNFLLNLNFKKSNKFIFYFSLFFFKNLKFKNNFLLNLNLIKSFFYLTKIFKNLKFKNNFFFDNFLYLWNCLLLKKFKKFFFFFRFKKFLKVSIKSSYSLSFNRFKRITYKKFNSYWYFNHFLNFRFLVRKIKFKLFPKKYENLKINFLSKIKFLNFISFYLILKNIINFDFVYNLNMKLEIKSVIIYYISFFSLNFFKTYLKKFNKFKNFFKKFITLTNDSKFFTYYYYYFKIKLIFYFSFYSFHFSNLRFEYDYYNISNSKTIFKAYLKFSNLFSIFVKKYLISLNLKNNKNLNKTIKKSLKIKNFKLIFKRLNWTLLKIIFNIMRLITSNAIKIVLLNRFLFETDYLSFSLFADTRYSFLFFGYNIYMNYLNKKFKFILNCNVNFKLFKFNSDEFLYIHRTRFFNYNLKLYDKYLLSNLKFSSYGLFMRNFHRWVSPYINFSEYYSFKKKDYFFFLKKKYYFSNFNITSFKNDKYILKFDLEENSKYYFNHYFKNINSNMFDINDEYFFNSNFNNIFLDKFKNIFIPRSFYEKNYIYKKKQFRNKNYFYKNKQFRNKNYFYKNNKISFNKIIFNKNRLFNKRFLEFKQNKIFKKNFIRVFRNKFIFKLVTNFFIFKLIKYFFFKYFRSKSIIFFKQKKNIYILSKFIIFIDFIFNRFRFNVWQNFRKKFLNRGLYFFLGPFMKFLKRGNKFWTKKKFLRNKSFVYNRNFFADNKYYFFFWFHYRYIKKYYKNDVLNFYKLNYLLNNLVFSNEIKSKLRFYNLFFLKNSNFKFITFKNNNFNSLKIINNLYINDLKIFKLLYSYYYFFYIKFLNNIYNNSYYLNKYNKFNSQRKFLNYLKKYKRRRNWYFYDNFYEVYFKNNHNLINRKYNQNKLNKNYYNNYNRKYNQNKLDKIRKFKSFLKKYSW